MTQADAVAADVAGLMVRYSFDLEGCTLDRWIDQWLRQYPKEWIYRAVVEALYQGRYKAISVWQILDLWRRRGKPLQHFNRDFERMISGQSVQLLFHPSERQFGFPTPTLINAKVGQSFSDSNTASTAWADSTARPDFMNRPDSPGRTDRIILTSFALQPSTEPLEQTNYQADSIDESASSQPSGQSAIQPFKPPQQFQLTLPSDLNRASAAALPIQRFIPLPESSEFHSKLKAIAQALVMENAEAAANAIEAAQAEAQAEPDTASSTQNPELNEPHSES